MRLSVRLLPLLALAGLAAGQEPLRETVSVSRLLLDVRAVDRGGRPLSDLPLEAFHVEVGGLPARVESSRWVTSSLPPLDNLERVAPGGWAADRGRLIVLLFQHDLLPSRIRGLAKMSDVVRDFLAGLRPEDRVALLVHDTRLHVYSDFTTDHAAVAALIAGSVIVRRPPPEAVAERAPSLIRSIDSDEAAGAAQLEDGLLVIARALRELPGTKSILFLGWSMNRWEGATDTLGTAVGYLVDGRTTLISLDVTRADRHTLEGPMVQASQETGGMYVKTHDFSRLAMSRVEQAIGGYYALSVVLPELEAGRHQVEVSFEGVRGTAHHVRFHDVR